MLLSLPPSTLHTCAPAKQPPCLHRDRRDSAPKGKLGNDEHGYRTGIPLRREEEYTGIKASDGQFLELGAGVYFHLYLMYVLHICIID